MMRFSIIIPTYNRAYVLNRPINSILAQTITDWELLIIDDGSTDDTEAKINAINDSRIKYIRQNKGGPSKARNTGIKNAAGDMIVYLDSDDAFHPEYLEHVGKANGRYGVCNHERTLIFQDANGKILSEKTDGNNQEGKITLQDFYDWRVKTTSSGLFHTKGAPATWRDVMIEDLDFILQLAEADPEGFMHIPHALVDYRQTYGGDGLCSQATYGLYAKAFGQIYEWHKNDKLMKNPEVYLGRVARYTELQKEVEAGTTPPPLYKYFPELAKN